MVLSYGPTWESARPVAYDSMALESAQLNYPVHKKELLAIIRALQKWQSELLGAPVLIYTDHQTLALENFDHQKDLSRQQACWQEFLAQYDHTIIYIPGESNTVADTLSHLPDSVDNISPLPIAATLSIQTDSALVKSIKLGYEHDPFCAKVSNTNKSIDGIEWKNGLLYVGS